MEIFVLAGPVNAILPVHQSYELGKASQGSTRFEITAADFGHKDPRLFRTERTMTGTEMVKVSIQVVAQVRMPVPARAVIGENGGKSQCYKLEQRGAAAASMITAHGNHLSPCLLRFY